MFDFPQPPTGGNIDLMFPGVPNGGNNRRGSGGGTLIGADGSQERPSFGPGGGSFPVFPPGPGNPGAADNRVPDFDELAARFDQLKNKGGK